MCGITGIWHRSNGAKSVNQELMASVETLRHRGPDDKGVWTGAGGVGLGHTRLSIIDLSRHGHQPMVSESGHLVMAFNGEIYNFAAIRRDLEPLGYSFKGNGDSEVLLAAFQEWGVHSVRRFVGMFAIALWDTQARKLTLIRDRLGIKPLYYGWDGETLCFGSELKALRAFHHWVPSVDRDALSDYFRFGYINAPRSIYQQVYKLPPGHYLELSAKGDPQVSRYWSVLDRLGDGHADSEDALSEELEALLIDAFRLRMVADVPVGVFLSGGIDSSLVTALLQKHIGEQVQTFTIGFNNPKFDEAQHARRVAEHLHTRHTERILESAEVERIIPQWGTLFDEPFADSSGIPTFLVSKMASEHVKVALSADGGDELFSGYRIYSGVLQQIERRKRIPRTVQTMVRGAGRLVDLHALDRTALRAPLPRFLRLGLHLNLTSRAGGLYDCLSADTPGEIYEQAYSFWNGKDLISLTGGTERLRELADSYPGSFAEKMCLWDLHNYLPGDILTKVDRCTMGASIEGREPLLDHRVVEFAFRLPIALRRGTLGHKHILRRILYRHVPREIVDRPKMGFAIPLHAWLTNRLRWLVDQHLDPTQLARQGILDPQVVRGAVHDFRLGDPRAIYRIWPVLAFQLWYEEWMS